MHWTTFNPKGNFFVGCPYGARFGIPTDESCGRLWKSPVLRSRASVDRSKAVSAEVARTLSVAAYSSIFMPFEIIQIGADFQKLYFGGACCRIGDSKIHMVALLPLNTVRFWLACNLDSGYYGLLVWPFSFCLFFGIFFCYALFSKSFWPVFVALEKF